MPIRYIRKSSKTHRLFLLLCVIVVGGILGAALYGVSAQKGIWFYVFSGALTAAIAGLILFAFIPFVEELTIKDVKVKLPTFGEVCFAPVEGERAAAYRLFVEASTRVATQRLNPNTGILREALTSLHSLFQETRETLKSLDPKCLRRANERLSVESAALTVLNQHLRPFLSKWHPLLTEFEKANPDKPDREWEHNQACREELEALRKEVVLYVRALGEIAEIPHLDDILRPRA